MFHILKKKRSDEEEKRRLFFFFPLSLLIQKTMENHLLRHGEAMEAELKAMGAVQLGVRSVEKWRAKKMDDKKQPSFVRSSVFDALSSNASFSFSLYRAHTRALFCFCLAQTSETLERYAGRDLEESSEDESK